MKRLYFAGSIRGGRDDADWYAALIEVLSARGVVLTEHIADPDSVDGGRTDEEIYERDAAWLRSSDAVIAEVTTPSLGVGYELGLAEALDKPVLCLFRKGTGNRLSAMVTGNRRFSVASYATLEEAVAAIDEFLALLDV